MNETVEFENEHVRMLRVKPIGRERHPHKQRYDRLIIYIHDECILHKAEEKLGKIRRKSGEVIWKSQSEHKIENLSEFEHEALLGEMKH